MKKRSRFCLFCEKNKHLCFSINDLTDLWIDYRRLIKSRRK